MPARPAADAGTAGTAGSNHPARRYRLYGLQVESGLPLPSVLPEPAQPGAPESPPDLRLTPVSAPPVAWTPEAFPALFASPTPSPVDPALPALTFHRLPGWDLLRFPETADFYLDTAGAVACHLRRPEAGATAEVLFLGLVLAFWFERTGRPALHAAAVAAGGAALALLAWNRGGKSTLAASLLAAGHPLLTDDVLPLEPSLEPDAAGFHALPSYPQMRLWPASAERFVAAAGDLPRVHPDIDKRRLPPATLQQAGYAFQSEPCPLARVYLPARRPVGDSDPAVRIAPVRPRDAVIELVRHSFLPRLCAAAGWQERRLDLFARLAREVPVRRLSYPDGFEHLPRVRDALLADLEAG